MKVWQRNCKLCPLHKTVYTVGMDGPLKSPSPKLMIYVDYPSQEEDKRHKSGYSNSIEVVRWLLDCLSLDIKDIQIQYTLKCFKSKQQLKKKDERLQAIRACSVHRLQDIKSTFGLHTGKPRSIVAMGPISCEAFFGGTAQKEKEGTKSQPYEKEIRSIVERVWVTYSPAVAPQDPAESLRLYRVLFCAAEEAGLKPKFNPIAAQKFDFDK